MTLHALNPIFQALYGGQAESLIRQAEQGVAKGEAVETAHLIMALSHFYLERFELAHTHLASLFARLDVASEPVMIDHLRVFAQFLHGIKKLSVIGEVGNALGTVFTARGIPTGEEVDLVNWFYQRGAYHMRSWQWYAEQPGAWLADLETPGDAWGFDLGLLIRNIGDLAIHASLYILTKGVERDRASKPVLTYESSRPLCNSVYVDYWRDYFDIVTREEARARGVPPLPKLAYGLVPGNIPISVDSALCYGLCRWEDGGGGPLLTLGDSHRIEGEKVLRKMGVPEGAWFACLHIREDGFYGGDSDSASTMRNTRIEAYREGIRAVTDRGGWVIRLGNPTMTPFEPMERLIDYPFGNWRSPSMDVFLAGACRFFIGTPSGMYIAAATFGVPVVLLNQTPMSQRSFSPRDIFTVKINRQRATGAFYSLAESMTYPLLHLRNTLEYEALEVDAVENSAAEIAEAVTEMLDQLDGVDNPDPEIAALRLKFDRLCGHDFGVSQPKIGRKFIKRWAKTLL